VGWGGLIRDSRPVAIPHSNHHQGHGFINPGIGAHRNPAWSVALPFFARRVASTLLGNNGVAAPRVTNDGGFLRRSAGSDVATLTWVGHSSVLVQMSGVSFLTDPTWSDTASPLPVGPRRYVAPGLALADLPPLDFVVISHNHYDHMDIGTLAALARRGTRFVVPLGNAELLRSHGIEPVSELDWWQSLEIAGVRVHCVPARHWSRRGLSDANEALWSGWVVSGEQRRFYFAGDTGFFEGFAEIARRLGPIDLAAVPIGAYEPVEMMQPVHLNPEEAVAALEALSAKRSLAIHFGTFDLTDEALDEPPRRFAAASRAAQRGPERDWVFAVGETRRW